MWRFADDRLLVKVVKGLFQNLFPCSVYFSKSSAFYLLCPSVHPVVWSSLCIHFSCLALHYYIIPQLFVGLIITYQLFYLYPSVSTIRCQIVMHLSCFPALSCLISRFDLVCVPLLLISGSVFCIVLTRWHWTHFCFSTSDYGLPFCSVAVIGLISGFRPSACDPVYDLDCLYYNCLLELRPCLLSLCYWITCITLICTCNTRFCLTLTLLYLSAWCWHLVPHLPALLWHCADHRLLVKVVNGL